MRFELEFPDSCYVEDKANYDAFVNALQLMLNRMANSHNKYQRGQKMHEVVEFIDEIGSALRRVAMYDDKFLREVLCECGCDNHQPTCFIIQRELGTGNTENLLDAANMLVIEFLFPKHSKAKFKAQPSSASPGLEYLP